MIDIRKTNEIILTKKVDGKVGNKDFEIYYIEIPKEIEEPSNGPVEVLSKEDLAFMDKYTSSDMTDVSNEPMLNEPIQEQEYAKVKVNPQEAAITIPEHLLGSGGDLNYKSLIKIRMKEFELEKYEENISSRNWGL